MLLECDGAHEVNLKEFSKKRREIFDEFLEDKLIHPAEFGQYLQPEQEYKKYPASYRRFVHWSITGACNLKCRHCFMSAPQAKHGAPSHEEIISIADQLAECGIFLVGITGGEPLVREDLLDIIDELNKREIGISVIFTNGWLLDEEFLDELEIRHMHPSFQLSYDGVGWHDFLRGVAGAEEKTLKALKLLKDRDYRVSVSVSLHRKNISTLRETVNLMAFTNRSVKCGTMTNLANEESWMWIAYTLPGREEFSAFEEYILYYFEDDAPLSITLGGAFMYTPGDARWKMFNVVECSKEDERTTPSCGVIVQYFYISVQMERLPRMAWLTQLCADNFLS